jgi:UDP-N-acetylglucosamine 4-epimerase
MRFLVTGGAGFIGSHICDYLIRNNARVVVIDNLSTGFLDNIEHLMNNPNFEFYEGDITNFDDCEKVISRVDIICHQAALGSVPRSIENPLNSHNSNVNGFLNILESARKHNIKRIVYASSSSVYGDDCNDLKQEEIIGTHLSPYAITKYVNELYANIYTKLYDMECIGLRYFNVFGSRQTPNGPYAAVIPKFIKAIKNNEQAIINGDGSYSRDFTHVDNIVLANINALLIQNEECFGQVFNISGQYNISILELYNLIKDAIHSDIEPIFGDTRKGDIPHSNANINKARELLNYEPIVNLKDGIKNVIEYYK